MNWKMENLSIYFCLCMYTYKHTPFQQIVFYKFVEKEIELYTYVYLFIHSFIYLFICIYEGVHIVKLPS